MTITLEQAKALQHGDELHHTTYKNADGSPMRFRVAGAVKTWKRDKNRIRIPIKRGLYENGYLVNNTCEGGRNFDIDIADVSLGDGRF